MRKTLLSLIALSLISFNLFASEALTTDTFRDVSRKVLELNSKYGSKNVLVVFDIDNTVLAMKRDLGSDQWFEWQAGMIFSETESFQKITSDFEELLKIQNFLYY